MTPSFREIPGSSCVLVTTRSGIWKQSRLYEYAGMLFAAVGSGFVRLYANKTTTSPNLRWEVYDAGAETVEVGQMGKLICLGVDPETPPHLRGLPDKRKKANSQVPLALV